LLTITLRDVILALSSQVCSTDYSEPITSPSVTKYKVIRDTCEHEGKGWIFSPTEHCAGTEDRNMFTADYSLDGFYDNKIFVIERKGSITEFVANLTHKEKWDDFKQELERMEEFKHPYIICEFPFELLSIFPRESGIPKSLWPKLRVSAGFIIKRVQEIEMKFKTKIVFAPGELGKQYASGLFKRIVEQYGQVETA
jgi:hypothetical protein